MQSPVWLHATDDFTDALEEAVSEVVDIGVDFSTDSIPVEEVVELWDEENAKEEERLRWEHRLDKWFPRPESDCVRFSRKIRPIIRRTHRDSYRGRPGSGRSYRSRKGL